jgi:hypothetical protein
MKRSTKAAKAKTPGPRTQSRPTATKSAKQQQRKKPLRTTRAQRERSVAPGAASSVPHKSKQAAVIALLRRSEGVTVAEVVTATGWQPHTVRGLFSGTLKKKLGLSLSSAEEDRGRVYRISDIGQTGEPARAGG